MIAAPLKTSESDCAITSVFGHAKWIGFYDEQTKAIQVVENYGHGPQVIALMQEYGVKTILTKHIGANPLRLALEAGMTVLHPGDERLTLAEAVEKMQTTQLLAITLENVDQFQNHKHHDHGHEHNH